MNYCLLENCKSDLISQREELIEYYNDNIEKIATILGVDKSNIPKEITISLTEGEGSSYSKDMKTITYRYKNKDNILEDKGKLIHEATHVVQDYPIGINDDSHPCWCWMEGIADYCGGKIDNTFNIEEGINSLSWYSNGYKDNAHFLSWLSKKYDNIIPRMNNLIYKQAHSISHSKYIFVKLINKDFLQLLEEYKNDYKHIFYK